MSQDNFVWTDELAKEFGIRCIVSITDKVPSTTDDTLQKFKEEKTKRDWEVVRYRVGPNIYTRENNDKDYFNASGNLWMNRIREQSLGANKEIYSVKRLSDGEVFSVGDEVEGIGVIEQFFIVEGLLFARSFEDEKYNLVSDIKKVVKPKPLFTTIDGKELFLGDTAFIAIDFDFAHEQILNTSDIRKWKDAKMFSTKEKAEEYILNNKPLLSVNDVQNVLNGQINRPVGIPFIESIKELAKQKLSK